MIPSEQVSDDDDSSLAEIKELGEISPASIVDLDQWFVAEAREAREPQAEPSSIDEVTANEIQINVSALTGIDLAHSELARLVDEKQLALDFG